MPYHPVIVFVTINTSLGASRRTFTIRSMEADEVRTNQTQIIKLVEQGWSIHITRQSKTVAWLTPYRDTVADPSVLDRFEQFRSRHKRPKDLTTRDPLNADRKI